MTTELQHIGIQPAAYRLPDEARVGRVRLQVNDLGISVPFYTQVLGFRVLSETDIGAVLGPEGGPGLIELRERRGARPVPRRGRIGLYHFAVEVEDESELAEAVDRIRAADVEFAAVDHGISKALYFSDPDGHGVEVYCDTRELRHRPEREGIAAPLDVDALPRD